MPLLADKTSEALDVLVGACFDMNRSTDRMETYLNETIDLYKMVGMTYGIAKENGDLNVCAFLMRFTRIISIMIGQIYTLRDKAQQMPTDYDTYDAHIDDWGINGVDLSTSHDD